MAKNSSLLSRSCNASVLGKCTETIPKIPVPENVKRDFMNKVSASGIRTQAEYVRMLILIDLYGENMIRSLQTRDLDSILSKEDE